MAEGRRGLGRGLSALLDEIEAPLPDAAGAPGRPGVTEAPIELVRPNPHQPRRRFDDAEMDELAASIRAKGLLQPILVRPAPETPGAYQIVAGERRWRAAQRAELRTIPVLVRELDDAETLEIAIVENVQRTDLSAIEEAESFRTLIERFGRTQATVADTVGKSRAHVASALRLLQLPPAVQDMVRDGKLTAGHARPFSGRADAEALARQVAERGMNVREAEALARDTGAPRPGGRPPKAGGRTVKDADTLSLEADLTEALGMPVEILDNGGTGELRIRYASLELLDDLCRRLTRR
jgi:ParB family chromosome partitioning protein